MSVLPRRPIVLLASGGRHPRAHFLRRYCQEPERGHHEPTCSKTTASPER
jgi:hypothetical protein